VKPQGPTTTPVTPTPGATTKSVQNTTSGTIPPIKPVDVPPVTTSQTTTPAEDTPAEPANEDKEEKIIDAGGDVVKPKSGFGKTISKWFDKASSAISKSMSADDEQNF
jgi:hypothetical protein